MRVRSGSFGRGGVTTPADVPEVVSEQEVVTAAEGILAILAFQKPTKAKAARTKTCGIFHFRNALLSGFPQQ
jgi:hypothetical protein